MATNVENGVQIFIKKDNDTVGYPITLGDSIVDLDKNTDFSAVKTTVNSLNTTVSNHTSNKSNPHGVTKSQLGLGNVENKSSATIRGELTSANVTTALGYTPPRTDTNTWRDVVDNLTSTDTTKSLSANQGKVLKGLVDGKAASNHTHSNYLTGITSAMVTTALGYTPAKSDTTYSDFTGASSSAAGKHGLVPAPAQGNQNSFLRGDGTWATPTDTKYSLGSFGITASATEINYTKGVTSAIQTQLNNKAASNHTHSNYLTGITSQMITTALGYTPPKQDTNTWRDVVDNLTSTATDKSLSANQGKVLKGLIDGLDESKFNHGVIYSGTSASPVNVDKINDPGIYLIKGYASYKISTTGVETKFPVPGNVPNSGVLVVFNADNTGSTLTDLFTPMKIYIPIFASATETNIPVMFIHTNTGLIQQGNIYGVWIPIYSKYNISTTANTISTFKSNIQQYGADPVRVLKSGNIVNIQGAVKNTVALGADKDYSAIPLFQLPSSTLYPNQTVRFVNHGSNKNTFCLNIQSDGIVSIERYGTTSVIQVPSGAWINVSCTYIVD